MDGYSGTPLVKKLGIKEGARVRLEQAPPGFVDYLRPLPGDAELLDAGPCEVILLFTESAADLEARFRRLASEMVPAGRFWVAWPKKASGVKTDLTEDVARQVGLPEGLVDNKVCAIDETWSGLQFVWRLENRPKG